MPNPFPEQVFRGPRSVVGGGAWAVGKIGALAVGLVFEEFTAADGSTHQALATSGDYVLDEYATDRLAVVEKPDAVAPVKIKTISGQIKMVV